MGWDACSGGVGEPLLRHDLTFGSDGLTCHADTSELDDFGTSGQQSGKRGRDRRKGPSRRHILGWSRSGWSKQARAGASDASKRFASPVAGCGLPRRTVWR